MSAFSIILSRKLQRIFNIDLPQVQSTQNVQSFDKYCVKLFEHFSYTETWSQRNLNKTHRKKKKKIELRVKHNLSKNLKIFTDVPVATVSLPHLRSINRFWKKSYFQRFVWSHHRRGQIYRTSLIGTWKFVGTRSFCMARQYLCLSK